MCTPHNDNMAAPAPWFIARPALDVPAQMLIVCIPHAGGSSAAFNVWATCIAREGMAAELLIAQLPGHMPRFAEPALTDMSALITALTDELCLALATRADQPFVLFGHSMGAAVAYELAHELARRRSPHTPRALFVSGRRLADRPAVRMSDFSDAALVAFLRHMGGTPDELLGEPSFVQFFLPPLRADLQLIASYSPTLAPLDQPPVFVLLGARDGATRELLGDDVDGLAADWGSVARAGCAVRSFDDGHFYCYNASLVASVLAHILDEAARCAAPAEQLDARACG